jgi:hypothetical protein
MKTENTPTIGVPIHSNLRDPTGPIPVMNTGEPENTGTDPGMDTADIRNTSIEELLPGGEMPGTKATAADAVRNPKEWTTAEGGTLPGKRLPGDPPDEMPGEAETEGKRDPCGSKNASMCLHCC